MPFADRTKRLPDRPGLYFAIKADGEILYIGMSRKSIRGRWKTWHLATVQIAKRKLGDQVRIAYIIYARTDSIAADERAVIREIRLTFNTGHVPGALRRQQQRDAEECEWIDCDEHWHDKWLPLKTPTKSRPCVCIVHASCGKQD